MPTGAKAPLEVEDYSWSADDKRLLVFTNSARVWRGNTRGDFWVLDVASGSAAQARRTGGQAVDAAVRQVLARRQARRLRPRAQPLRRVARDGKITPLTTDGSKTIINGTFDWVYEEELSHPRRLPLEPGRSAHRLLAARRERRARLPAHQQHRLVVLVHRSGAVPESRNDQLVGAHRRRERERRSDDVDESSRRSAQQLSRAHGLGSQPDRAHDPAAQPTPDGEHHVHRRTPRAARFVRCSSTATAPGSTSTTITTTGARVRRCTGWTMARRSFT